MFGAPSKGGSTPLPPGTRVTKCPARRGARARKTCKHKGNAMPLHMVEVNSKASSGSVHDRASQLDRVLVPARFAP